jgi:hypothetical protein
MALERLVDELEAKLGAIKSKRELLVSKGLLELYFSMDRLYWDSLLELGILKGMDQVEKKAKGSPARSVDEIADVEKRLFELTNREWVKRLKNKEGKGDMDDFKYGLLQGELIALEWVLGRDGAEIF